MNENSNYSKTNEKEKNISNYLSFKLNLSLLPQILSVISFLVGMAAFMGWVFSIHLLKSIIPNAIEMKANTSIGIMLASIALFLISFKNKKKIFEVVILGIAIVVFLIGLINLCQYLFGWNLKIDELIFRDSTKLFTAAPGRLAFLTAVSFILIGLTLFALQRKKIVILIRLMALTKIAIGFSVQIAYLWHAKEIVSNQWTTPVALNTAFCIMVLGLGLLLVSFENLTFNFNSVEKKVLAGFTGTFLLILVSAGYTYKTTTEYSNSAKWVMHTQTVRLELSDLHRSILNVQSMQRSYLLTNNKSLKEDYLKSISKLNEQKDKLEQLILDNSIQIKSFTALDLLIKDRINQLNLNISTFEEKGDTIKSITIEDSLLLMEKIARQITNMKEHERVLLLEREKSLSENQKKIILSLLATLIISVIILVFLFIGIRREMEGRKTAEGLLQAAKEKAENANRAKDSFLAIMSHEIRTPLTGMLGMLELLSMTPMEEEQTTTLDAAWDSGRGLLRIVSDILDWSKIEEGKLELSPRPTSISQLLKEVVNAYSKVASSKSLILWQHCDSRLSAAHIVDSLRLSQVLNNFVSNAIKFTSRGEIEVRAVLRELKDGSERVCFSVKDTGIGIPKDVQSKLFQNYRQESADTARMYGGTGLGLAICRRLSELMDGEITLESAPGEGSVFSIILTLPISSVPAETIQRSRLDVAQRAIKPIYEDNAKAPLILAVDDHPTNRDLLARQIKLLGFRSETAENGRIALRMWQENRFNMVITDCHMPEMDGYTLSKSIRKLESEFDLPRTPIIGWTANALPEEEKHCKDSGMDDLLIKPTDMAQLKNKLSGWLALIRTDIIESKSDNPNKDPKVEPIDYSFLNNIVRDIARQTQILVYFQSHIHKDYLHLLEMLEIGDINGIENTSHRMKGSSLMVGAKKLGAILEVIEKASIDRNLEKARAEIPNLNEAISQIEKHCSTLETYKGSNLES